MNVGFIGYGRMGSALAQGAVSAGCLRKTQVWAHDYKFSSQAKLKKLGFKYAVDLAELVENSDTVFICVKPQGMDFVLDEISATMDPATLRKKSFVSIAAGVRTEKIEKMLGKGVSVVRVMPNTPALLGAGMSGIAKGKNASAAHLKFVSKILSSVGKTAVVSERLMDAVTAVSGSGPAYVFYLAEAMMAQAKKFGFTPKEARLFVHQTVYGAGQMLNTRPETAEELRRQVTSPGGTTEAALKEFMKKKLGHIIGSGLQKAAARSRELQ